MIQLPVPNGMRVLAAFCGVGGCTRGYQLAGFHVTGIDIAPQPRYCGDEISCDGPDEQTDCPDSAAVPARFASLTAREVRADGRALGWAYRLRAGRLVDVCSGCSRR